MNADLAAQHAFDRMAREGFEALGLWYLAEVPRDTKVWPLAEPNGTARARPTTAARRPAGPTSPTRAARRALVERDAVKLEFAKIVSAEGQTVLGWREIPTDNSSLGKTAVDGLLGADRFKSMGAARGAWHAYADTPLRATYPRTRQPLQA